MHGQPKYGPDDQHLSYVNPKAPKGGSVKIAEIGTFDTLNPYSIKGESAAGLNLVYDRLMRRVWDEPFTMYPLIAERVDVPEDRSSITFYINPKARFHDDSAITAHDVLFSYETLKKYGRPNMRRVYDLVKTATVKDEHEIHFALKDGYNQETIMILAMMPVLSQKWWDNRDFEETLTQTPPLNGPYRIKEFEAGRKITYERVSDYWANDLLVNKGHYNIDEITYEYFRDDTIALEAFKKGDLDLRREWDVSKWQSAYKDLSPDIIHESVPHKRPERAHGFVFNIRKSPFDDIRVRKALLLAFDADWVRKNLFHGQFQRINSFFPNSILATSLLPTEAEKKEMKPWKENLHDEVFVSIGSDFYSPLIPRAGANPPTLRLKLRQADMMLRQAGWIIENGVRIHEATKRPFTFELLLSTPQEKKIALNYQKSLQRLGIKMDVRLMDSASFQDRKNIYDYDMIAYYWQNSLSPGTEQMLYWSCQAAESLAQFNYSGVCNPALDHFLQKIADAKNYDDLTLYAHIIDRILLSENIFIPLFYKGVDYVSYNKKVKRPKQTPQYGVVTETWWIKNEQAQ